MTNDEFKKAGRNWESRRLDTDKWQVCNPFATDFREGWSYRIRPAPAMPATLPCPCCGGDPNCLELHDPITACRRCGATWHAGRRAPCPTCAELRAELGERDQRRDMYPIETAGQELREMKARAEAAEKLSLAKDDRIATLEACRGDVVRAQRDEARGQLANLKEAYANVTARVEAAEKALEMSRQTVDAWERRHSAALTLLDSLRTEIAP